MKGKITDKIRIQHILDAIKEIDVYLTSVSFEDFLANSEKRFATIKQIEIIGEACNHLSNELKQTHPEIEWRQINGFRKFLFMSILVLISISYGTSQKMTFQGLKKNSIISWKYYIEIK